ncbi:MAG: hypothetical protein JSU81_05395 [Candidatus Coatesbacteria bacterium]|nr:MAG: hypothetical protein JSU81_05395 [Candidatus Coatesbacteria bacterium]
MNPTETALIVTAAVGAGAVAVGLYSWLRLRGLAARVRRLEGRTPAAGEARLERNPLYRPGLTSPEVPLTVRAAVDVRAPGEVGIFGVNASGYVPIATRNGSGGHFVVAVLRLTNFGRDPLFLRNPYLVLPLADGASKLEPPATLAGIGRLTFYDAKARTPRLLAGVAGHLWDRTVDGFSLHRSAVELGPLQSVVSYASFLPRRLELFPVFDDYLLRFGVGFYVGDRWCHFGGFAAPPLSGLAVTYEG